MEVTLKLSDLVEMQSKHTCFIYFIKKLASGLPVAKNLIEYNCNDLEENEEKEPINIELTEQKADPKITKMPSTLNNRCTRRRRGKYCFG